MKYIGFGQQNFGNTNIAGYRLYDPLELDAKIRSLDSLQANSPSGASSQGRDQDSLSLREIVDIENIILKSRVFGKKPVVVVIPVTAMAEQQIYQLEYSQFATFRHELVSVDYLANHNQPVFRNINSENDYRVIFSQAFYEIFVSRTIPAEQVSTDFYLQLMQNRGWSSAGNIEFLTGGFKAENMKHKLWNAIYSGKKILTTKPLSANRKIKLIAETTDNGSNNVKAKSPKRERRTPKKDTTDQAKRGGDKIIVNTYRSKSFQPIFINEQIAGKLRHISELYSIKPDDWRANTYSRVSDLVLNYDKPINSGKEAQKIKGIGKSVATDIDQFLATGEIEREQDLIMALGDKQKVLQKFIGIFDVGPVKANILYDRGYRGIAELQRAVSAGELELTSSQRLGVQYYDDINRRIPRAEIEKYEEVIRILWSELEQQYKVVDPDFHLEWQIVGSYRRGCATSGDIDILIKNVPKISNLFFSAIGNLRQHGLLVGDLKIGSVKYLGIAQLNTGIAPTLTNQSSSTKGALTVASRTVERIVAQAIEENGTSNSTGAVRPLKARRIDLTLVQPENWAYALLHATGSKNLNVLMRQRAIEQGWTLSELGIQDVTGEIFPAESEEDIFRILGMKYLEPTQRKI